MIRNKLYNTIYTQFKVMYIPGKYIKKKVLKEQQYMTQKEGKIYN